MKQGNQFYLYIEVADKNDKPITPEMVDKISFSFGLVNKELIKQYPSDDVNFDNTKQAYKVWLTQEETFNFENKIKMDIRVKFKDNTIIGSRIIEGYCYDSITKEVL